MRLSRIPPVFSVALVDLANADCAGRGPNVFYVLANLYRIFGVSLARNRPLAELRRTDGEGRNKTGSPKAARGNSKVGAHLTFGDEDPCLLRCHVEEAAVWGLKFDNANNFTTVVLGRVAGNDREVKPILIDLGPT